MKPLVSFIVTYHNEPKALLEACLGSIRALRLSADEAEVIVVDDGMTLSDSPLLGETLVRQEQSGLSVARNTGIDASQGRYIQFVDADDAIIPEAYEIVLEQLRKGQADVVQFRMTKKYSSKSPLKRETFSLPLREGRGGSFLQHRNLRAAAWGYAFRRSVLGELRFCPGILHEDELFTPQLFLRANSLVELDAEAYFYRQHEGTITHSKEPGKVKKRLDDIHFILRELHSLGNPLLERRVRQLTVDYLQNVWTLTHSIGEVRRRARELRGEGFLPLPMRRYSLRYLLFSLFV